MELIQNHRNDDSDNNNNNNNNNKTNLLGKLSQLRGTGLWTVGGGTQTTTIRLSDGPHGVRKQLNDLSLQQAHPATCFPAGCALASSWNLSLLNQVGTALALECQHYDVQVLLGPGMNIKRHPACGRNMEYFSEDPTLSGLLAAAYVNGVQNNNHNNNNNHSKSPVAACLKHFAVNNQESHRMVVDAMVDERTLRELYLLNFEIAIRESQPKMIMGAYNKLNGVYCCENKWLLDYVLRQEWKWGNNKDDGCENDNDDDNVGICVTDWGATNNRAKAIAAGMDLEMPGSDTRQGVCDGMVRDAVLVDGDVDVEQGLAMCTKRMDRFIQYLADNNENEDQDNNEGEYEDEYERNDATNQRGTTTTCCTGDGGAIDDMDLFEANHNLAYEAALECAILLQNHNDLLPLSSELQKDEYNNNDIAVIGAFAKESRYQGMGSSHVTPTKVENAYDVLTDLLSNKNGSDDDDDNDENQPTVHIPYAAGYDPDPQHTDDTLIDEELIQEATQIAKNAKVVLIFLGVPEILESEGFDRDHLRLPMQQTALLEATWKARGHKDIDKIVVVLSNGGAMELPDVAVNHCSSILEGYLWGQAGAKAMAHLIFGVASPCGKLPETFPMRQSDIPADAYFPGTRHVVEYREGLDVGYRYFDSPECPHKVQFPFGHGLSYTTFAYENIKAEVVEDETQSKRVVVECDIVNSGTTHPAREIVQCYVAPRFGGTGIYRPYHQLQAFTKVPTLKPGERHSVEFELDYRAFAVWDIGHESWVVEAGDYEIQIGASGQDIRLRTTISFAKGEELTAKAIEAYPAAVTFDSGAANDITKTVTDDVFVKRFGDNSAAAAIQAYRDEPELRVPYIHRNSMMKEVAKVSVVGRLLLLIIVKVANMEVPRNSPSYRRETRMLRANIDNLPLRTLVLFSKGGMSFEFLDALICVMNGQVFKSIRGFYWMFRCWVVDKVLWFSS